MSHADELRITALPGFPQVAPGDDLALLTQAALTRGELSLELSRLWQELRRTALLITHSIDEAVLLGDRLIVMSRRPGRIGLDMPIDLPRPRDVNTENHPRFLEIRQAARDLLFSRDKS